MENNIKANQELRERSGNVQFNSKLISFLYELMRDHVLLGDIESLVRSSESIETTLYSNGWLANYAADIAKRLQD